MRWTTARRNIEIQRPLVMAILNLTPDSFSDGGAILSVDDALKRAEECFAEGADILDIGGESTRPGSSRVPAEDEVSRVVPVVEAIAKRFDVPISVDTSKSDVAARAIDAGAEIINDISAMRFDGRIGKLAADTKCGLVLMHSRGEFETMHEQTPVHEIMDEVARGFRDALELADVHGISAEAIVLDVGIGFGKTFEQNLELLAKLDKLTAEFPTYPMLVGTSRKSFIGRLMGDAPADRRLSGSLATAAVAIMNGAKIIRVHDVKETVEIVKVIEAVREQL
jgi:dihydropteroate synthase